MVPDTSSMQLKYVSSCDLSLMYPAKSTPIHVWLQMFHPSSAEALKKIQSVQVIKKKICIANLILRKSVTFWN